MGYCEISIGSESENLAGVADPVSIISEAMSKLFSFPAPRVFYL